jgi:hypothetical protein
MVDASSAKVTSGDSSLVGPLLRSPADPGAGRNRWGARGRRTRDGGIRTARVVWDAGGRRRSGGRVGRATIGKADDFGTSNDESIEGVGPDVGPLDPGIHSREAGEFAG